MKRTIYFMITMIFALTLRAAFASELSKELYNGVTDFTGGSYDTFEITPMNEVNSIERASAGGLRTGEATKELYNGVTDFTGRSYDTFEIGQAGPGAEDSSHESSAAGGLREGESGKELYNGITDFSGRSYDTFEISRKIS